MLIKINCANESLLFINGYNKNLSGTLYSRKMSRKCQYIAQSQNILKIVSCI